MRRFKFNHVSKRGPWTDELLQMSLGHIPKYGDMILLQFSFRDFYNYKSDNSWDCQRWIPLTKFRITLYVVELNKLLDKQSMRSWFETLWPSCSASGIYDYETKRSQLAVLWKYIRSNDINFTTKWYIPRLRRNKLKWKLSEILDKIQQISYTKMH